MDRNNGLEVRISKEETTTIVTMYLGETPPIITTISLQDQTSHMGLIAQTMEDLLINAEISHLIERWKPISKWIFQQLEWELAKQLNFFSFSIDPNERFFTK